MDFSKCLQLSYVCGIQAHNLALISDTSKDIYSIFTYIYIFFFFYLRNVEVFFFSLGERDRLQ